MDDQARYYKAKLQYEIDPWDLNEALGRGDKVILVDTRSPEAYERGHFRVKELIGGLDCWRVDGYPVDGSESVQPAGTCRCS